MVDISDYVDEYHFVPLTPDLEDALSHIVADIDESRGDRPRTDVEFAITNGFDDCRELTELGYLRESSSFIDGSELVRLTPKGSRYAAEKRAYEGRKDAWITSHSRDRRHDLFFQLGIALLSFTGGIICTLLGELLRINS